MVMSVIDPNANCNTVIITKGIMCHQSSCIYDGVNGYMIIGALSHAIFVASYWRSSVHWIQCICYPLHLICQCFVVLWSVIGLIFCPEMNTDTRDDKQCADVIGAWSAMALVEIIVIVCIKLYRNCKSPQCTEIVERTIVNVAWCCYTCCASK